MTKGELIYALQYFTDDCEITVGILQADRSVKEVEWVWPKGESHAHVRLVTGDRNE